MADENYAESYRNFFLFLLQDTLKLKPHPVLPKVTSKINGKGLYFFFWSVDNTEGERELYPLYVGRTRTSFRKRFNEHSSCGVIKKIKKKEWPEDKHTKVDRPRIVAYVYKMNISVAKYLESLFLNAFDFAMNIEENKKRRPGLDRRTTHSVKEGFDHFKGAYDDIKKNLETFDNKMVALARINFENLEIS